MSEPVLDSKGEVMNHKTHLREIRNAFPDLPDCCQRCKLFLNLKPEKYKQAMVGDGKDVLVVDDPTVPASPGQMSLAYAVKCPCPNELRGKNGEIPKKYISYCSDFLKDDLASADVVATYGEAAKTALGIQAKYHLPVSKRDWESGKQIVDQHAMVRLGHMLDRSMTGPESRSFAYMQRWIDSELASKGHVRIGLDFEWNTETGKVHTVGVGNITMCAYSYFTPEIRNWLRGIVANPKVTICGHDLARAEIPKLFEMGITNLRCKWEDSMVSTWEMMDRAGNVGLKPLVYKYCPEVEQWDHGIDDYSEYTDTLGKYCAKDAWASVYFIDWLIASDPQRWEQLAYAHHLDMEMLVPIAWAMYKGIGLAYEKIVPMRKVAEDSFERLEKLFLDNYGITKPGDPAQLKAALNDRGAGCKSTNEAALVYIKETKADNLDLLTLTDMILEYRSYKSGYATYLKEDSKVLEAAKKDGKVHAWAHIGKANTGRPSYAQPNLAGINKDIRNVLRTTFGDEGSLLSYDRGQSEYRVVTYMSQHEALIEAFNNGIDIHTYAAEAAMISRTDAKTLNFAYLFYAKDVKLLEVLRKAGCPNPQLGLLQFKEAMSSLRDWQERAISEAYGQGFVQSPYGRRGTRLRPTTIVNFPVQSWSADLNKLTLLKFYKEMRAQGLESYIWLEYYDGTEIDAYKPEIPIIEEISKQIFTEIPDIYEYGINLPFPLEGTDYGTYWGGSLDG